MTITASGIASGLDVDSIISSLMTIEQQPLTVLQTKEASYQAKLSAFGSVKSALSQFQTSVSALASASKFQGTKATVSDSKIVTATATSIATTGTYSLEVSQLAEAQKLVADGIASSSTAIGNGTITIDFGTISGGTLDEDSGQYTGASFNSNGAGVKTITIDSSNNSLTGIRDAINAADAGVTATIVNDGSNTPYRLVLSSDSSGESYSMKISVAGDAALSSLLSHDPGNDTGQALSETASAANAEFEVNGVAITKSSNTVSDVISGVTLNLVDTNVGSTAKITIARDTATVTSAVNSFVTAYNTIVQTLQSATAYDSETKTAATLNGDSTIRSIQAQIRSILNTPVSGGASAFTMLSQVGVSIGKDGTMSVDSSKLQSALSTNFADFAGLFAAAGKTSDSLITYTGSTDKTKAGAYAVNITQLASQGKVVAAAAAGLTIDSSNNKLVVELDGNTETITLASGTYTAAALATEIQSKINGTTTFSNANSSVKVTQSGGVLTLTSDRYGSASNISITGGNGQSNLNLGVGASITDGVDVAGTINGAPASGSGQRLTGATGNDSEGITLTVTGGGLGSRGTVNYSQGFAYRLDQLMESLLDDEGVIAAKTDGLQSTIERLQDDQERISERLVSIEARYRAQFTALEVLIGNLNSTSSYLTQQLEALSNLNKQISS